MRYLVIAILAAKCTMQCWKMLKCSPWNGGHLNANFVRVTSNAHKKKQKTGDTNDIIIEISNNEENGPNNEWHPGSLLVEGSL